MTIASIRHDYAPRTIFVPFHHRTQRWALLVAHRRAGKTVATVNDEISRALYFDAYPEPRFAYIAPFYGQAKKIAWSYLKRYGKAAASRVLESDLSITIRHNEALISLYGADNPDSFRGQYFDGVILDEYGNMRPSVWSEVLLPTLIDRRGWATFIGTPNGPNHFRDMYHRALKDPSRWYVDLLPVSRTKLIPQEELDEMKRMMTEEEYEQEMECSFEASTKGAFYAREIRLAKEQGRITPRPPDPGLPLHFVFDLGFSDDTSLGAFQQHPDGVNIVHAEDDHMRAMPYYFGRMAEICQEYGCARGQVWLPHDAKAKTLQTGLSIVEQFIDHGIRPFLVPELDILDGIAACRTVFQYVHFNEPGTEKLVLAIKSYHRKFDEDKQSFKNEPVHDWASHPCDMLRYLSLVAKFPVGLHYRPPQPQPSPQTIIIPSTQAGAHYAFTLDDLWENARARNSSRIQ